MNRSFLLAIRWLSTSLLLATFLACSPSGDECQTTSDCKKSKGSTFVCSLKDGKRTCVKKSSSGNCNPACTGNQKCVNGTCVSCQDDTDCSPGEACTNGSCQSKNSGGCNPACQSGQKCINGSCVQCTVDGDCQTGEKCNNNKCEGASGCNPPCNSNEKCENNKCVPNTTGCTKDTDCAASETCNTTTGKCEPKPTGCNPPCQSNEKCENNKCVPKTTGCTKDTDCAANETCNTSTGKCEPKPTGCNPPCQSNEKCENNKCVPKTTGCTKDTDCAANETCNTSTGKCEPKTSGCNPPCQSNEKCVNNQCVQCTSNTDCAASEKCEQGKCVPNTIQCNPPCQSGEKCVSGKCVQCTSNSDCPSNQTCNNGKCSSSTTCQSNSDCSGGLICQNNVCISPVGSSCAAPATCPSGYQCLNANNKSICFQTCTVGGSICANNTKDGRTSCLVVGTNSQTNQPVAVCMKEAKKGESCNAATWTTTGQALCDSNATPPLYCNKANKCAEFLYRKKVGETCNKQNDTNEPRYLCDQKLNLVCSESTGKCINAKIAKEGEACDLQGTTLGTPTICDPKVTDMICVRFDSSGSLSRCQRKCDPNKAGQCSHNSNLTCWKVFNDGTGMCFDLTCTQNSDCAFSNYECRNNPLGGSGKVCWPLPPTGPKAYAESCGNPISTKGCKAGVSCLLTNDETGFCTTDCGSATCGTAKDANGKTITAQCETFGSGTNTFKRCVFPCGSTGQTCPKDITHCQDVTNSSGQNKKICSTKPPVGPNDYGAICSSPTSQKGCKTGLFCLRSTNATNGYCTKECTTTCTAFKDADGKSFTPTCKSGLLRNPICIVSCGQPGQTCPKGTTCTTLSAGQYCLAP